MTAFDWIIVGLVYFGIGWSSWFIGLAWFKEHCPNRYADMDRDVFIAAPFVLGVAWPFIWVWARIR